MKTTIALTLLTTPEDEEPQLKGDVNMPICLPKSLERWRKKEGYKKVKSKFFFICINVFYF